MNTTSDLEDFLQTPMDLLELPDSIFRLFEDEDTNPDQSSRPSSSSVSNLNSLYCSTNCSRWPSFSSALDDIDSIINEDIWKDDANLLTIRAADHAVEKPSLMDIFSDKESKDAQVQTDGDSAFDAIPDYEGLEPLTLDDIQSKPRKSRPSSVFSSRSGSSSTSKRRSKKAQGRHVLHFLLNFLQEDTNHSFIHWVDKPQGIFRVDKNQANEIVRRWNRKKGSGVKDWNNFARTLRNHYKGEKSLEPVKEHYTYKFSREFMEHSKSAAFGLHEDDLEDREESMEVTQLFTE